MAERRHIEKPKAIKMDESLRAEVGSLIHQRWSPEQIRGRLKLEDKPYVSHETIYRYLLNDKEAGGQLYKNLRHQAKPYRKRYVKPDGRGKTLAVSIFPSALTSLTPRFAWVIGKPIRLLAKDTKGY